MYVIQQLIKANFKIYKISNIASFSLQQLSSMTDLNKLFAKPTQQAQPNPLNLNRKTLFTTSQYVNRSPVDLFGPEIKNNDKQISSFRTMRTTTSIPTLARRTQKQYAKTTVQNQNMFEQIEFFRKNLNNQFYKKVFIIVFSFISLAFFGLINKKICFQLILFAVSFIMAENIIFQIKSLRIFIKSLPILLYTALFYDILTQNKLVFEYYITLANLPALMISLIAAINFYATQKVQFLAEKNLRDIEITMGFKHMLKYFVKKYQLRIRNIINLSLYFFTLNSLLVIGFIVYCTIYHQVQLAQETIFGALKYLIVYWIIDIFVFTIQFLSRQVHFSNLKYKMHDVHVCMSLLRLKKDSKNEQVNSKIQSRCLIELSRELKIDSDYLDNPVKVNYAINNYRDIFQIYASNQLALLLSNISQISMAILKNNHIISSKKTWRQDLWIEVRKLTARLQNDFLLLKTLSEVQKRKYLFIVLVKLSTESPLRTQILQSLSDIIECVRKDTSKIKQDFNIGQKKTSEWIIQLQTLKAAIKNQSVGLIFNRVSQVDTNGWAHYKRPDSQRVSVY